MTFHIIEGGVTAAKGFQAREFIVVSVKPQ